jgi:hypothetical protein
MVTSIDCHVSSVNMTVPIDYVSHILLHTFVVLGSDMVMSIDSTYYQWVDYVILPCIPLWYLVVDIVIPIDSTTNRVCQ